MHDFDHGKYWHGDTVMFSVFVKRSDRDLYPQPVVLSESCSILLSCQQAYKSFLSSMSDRIYDCPLSSRFVTYRIVVLSYPIYTLIIIRSDINKVCVTTRNPIKDFHHMM